MPHLSPISWPLALLSFWLLLTLLMTHLWWLQLPHFPNITFPQHHSHPPQWPWK